MHDRILTTHVGSLPRGSARSPTCCSRPSGASRSTGKRFDEVVAAAVDDCVARQVAAGVDLVSDGEMSKISYATYIKDRITGFDGDSERRTPADLEAYPSFAARQAKGGGTPAYRRPRCVAPIAAHVA